MRRLDNNGAGSQCGNDAIACKEASPRRPLTWWGLADQNPAIEDVREQPIVSGRVHDIDTARYHCDRAAADNECTSMGSGIDAVGGT